MLPPSLRPLIWTLLLNPRAPIEIPRGPSLPRARFEQLKTLVESALCERGLDENERKRRQRFRDPLDPGMPALVLADEWQGAPPSLGMPVAIDASAMLYHNRLIASPSQAGYPVYYTVASVTTLGGVALRPPSQFIH